MYQAIIKLSRRDEKTSGPSDGEHSLNEHRFKLEKRPDSDLKGDGDTVTRTEDETVSGGNRDITLEKRTDEKKHRKSYLVWI